MPKKSRTIGYHIVTAYGLIYAALFLYGIFNWQGFVNSQITTLPLAMLTWFNGWAQWATLLITATIAYGLLNTQWWVKYLYLAVFLVITLGPPWTYTLVDILAIFFDQLILYLMFLNPHTKTLFEG